jgi:ferric-dicitrate binding protein FerR (iron transport regulator)
MNTSSSYNIPWELIGSSFCRSLSNEEEVQLQQWLDSNSEHRDKYRYLQEIWNNSTEDYKFYLMVNENKAWENLSAKLSQGNGKVVKLESRSFKFIYRIAAVAAVFLLIAGAYWFFALQNKPTTISTALNQKETVDLNGVSVSLNSETTLEVSKNFNKTDRTVKMISGEAVFDVKQKSNLPFIVDLGEVTVKDVGTVFDVKKDKEMIKVAVSRGMVILSKLSSNETKELKAGMSVTYNISASSFGEIQMPPAAQINDKPLVFDNTPLKDVIDLIQKKYNKTILLKEEKIADKKLTAHLEGLPFTTAVEVICKSLNLEYDVKDSVYILRKKM